MVINSLGINSRRIIFSVLAVILLQGIFLHSAYAVTQGNENSVSYLNGLYESKAPSIPKTRLKETGAAQQKVLRLARNCRTLKVYRRRCATRYSNRRQCKRVRTVVRQCKRVPVRRRVCSVRTTRVKRCRGPLGQRRCSMITQRKRSCFVRTTRVTRCRQAHRTTRRCRNVRVPRRVCQRKVSYIRRCSGGY